MYTAGVCNIRDLPREAGGDEERWCVPPSAPSVLGDNRCQLEAIRRGPKHDRRRSVEQRIRSAFHAMFSRHFIASRLTSNWRHISDASNLCAQLLSSYRDGDKQPWSFFQNSGASATGGTAATSLLLSLQQFLLIVSDV